MFKKLQKIIQIISAIAFGSLSLFIIVLMWMTNGFHNDSHVIEPRLAFWMEPAWSTGEVNDFVTLKSQIQEFNISDLYFHVGPLDAYGSLADDLKIDAANLAALSTTNYAWIGQIRGQIDIDDELIREEVILSAKEMINQGFDGIHIDIEPFRSEDESFYSLVEEMRAAMPGIPISIAMDQWQPHTLTQFFASYYGVSIESYWDTSQVERIAEYVDQMVVMTYDTGFTTPELYIWWVEQQVIALSKRMDDDTEIFIGIPSYEKAVSIDPATENVQTGLEGFQSGMTNLRTDLTTLAGVAIYSYWEMDEDEWEILRTYEATTQQ